MAVIVDSNHMSKMEPNSNFKVAREVYFDRIKLVKNKVGQEIRWDQNSKYAVAARDGLCFHCFRDDGNPDHRPKHPIFALCVECDAALSYGYEKIERLEALEMHKWSKMLKQ